MCKFAVLGLVETSQQGIVLNLSAAETQPKREHQATSQSRPVTHKPTAVAEAKNEADLKQQMMRRASILLAAGLPRRNEVAEAKAAQKALSTAAQGALLYFSLPCVLSFFFYGYAALGGNKALTCTRS